MKLQVEINEAHFTLAWLIKGCVVDYPLPTEMVCPTSLAVLAATGLAVGEVETDGAGRIAFDRDVADGAFPVTHRTRAVSAVQDVIDAFDLRNDCDFPVLPVRFELEVPDEVLA